MASPFSSFPTVEHTIIRLELLNRTGILPKQENFSSELAVIVTAMKQFGYSPSLKAYRQCCLRLTGRTVDRPRDDGKKHRRGPRGKRLDLLILGKEKLMSVVRLFSVRHVLILGLVLLLSACTAIQPPSTSTPSPTAGTSTAVRRNHRRQ